MVTNSQGSIITFYSYKGGVGRSMILANVAWILASNGKRVLVVDWDLEAPGLHRYFHPFLLDKDLSASEGLMEFVTDFRSAALIPADKTEGDDDNWHEPYANILHYAVSLNWEFPNQGTIDFVPAGQQNDSYATRVNLFNWHDFYERFGGGIFLETAREKMRAEYDYILIDSRTGVSDTSGICTVQMPDRLVIVFTGNIQSISGAIRVATSVSKYWQADDSRSQNQWSLFPVFSRTDRTEKDKLDLTKDYIKDKFAPFLPPHLSETEREEYWGNVEIPYIPWYAYEEVLATFRDDPHQRDSLLAAVEQLVTYLTHQEVDELVPLNQEKREKVLFQFTQQFAKKPYAVCFLYNKEDSDPIEKIATYFLEQKKLEVWFAQWELVEGMSWEQNLKRGLEVSSTCAVFVGQSDKYAWQQFEVEIELRHRVKNQGIRVIPVLLPNASQKPQLPSFMSNRAWIEFRYVLDEEALWYFEREIGDIPYEQRKHKNISKTDLSAFYQALKKQPPVQKMPISEVDLRRFFNALNDQPLEVDDPFYEPYLPGYYDPIKELERHIIWSDRESITWFSGSRGSGKSTELRRLRHLLEQQDYTVFLCDMEGFLNQYAPVEITDFLVSIVLALNEQLKNTYAQDFTAKGFLERFAEFLRSEAKLDEFGIGDLTKGTLVKDYDFKQRLQNALRNHVDSVVEQVRCFVANIAEFVKVKKNEQHQLVLIVDSVEKMRGIGTDAQLVYKSVENLFKHHGDKLRLDNWHVVYTVPPYITFLRLGNGNSYQLPNVHVFNREGYPDASGMIAMKNVIQRRFEQWESIFSATQLGQMILATGGDFQDFFRLIKTVLRKIPIENNCPQIPVAETVITQAKSDLLNNMLPISNDDMAWLRQIAATHQPEIAGSDLSGFIGLLYNNLVLTYRNGEHWYEVHPLLKERLDLS